MFLDPEGKYFLKAMHRVADPDAALREFEFHEIRRYVGEHADERCRKEDEDREEGVVEEYGDDSGTYGDDAKRPEPITPALDVLVLVGAPPQNYSRFGHR